MQFEVSDLLFPGFTKDAMNSSMSLARIIIGSSRWRNGVNVHFRFMLPVLR